MASDSENGTETKPPRQKRKAPQRRGYKGELEELQADHADLKGRVATAVKLLVKIGGSEANSPAAKELISVAMDTLTGE